MFRVQKYKNILHVNKKFTSLIQIKRKHILYLYYDFICKFINVNINFLFP